jgi:hypothetical protein
MNSIWLLTASGASPSNLNSPEIVTDCLHSEGPLIFFFPTYSLLTAVNGDALDARC